jgi:hypothetical protein
VTVENEVDAPRTYRVNPFKHTADSALPVDEEFAGLFQAMVESGSASAREQRVCFVGMARDIAGVLPFSLARLESLGARFQEWRAVVVENDSTDGTKEILLQWEHEHAGRVIADCRDLGREHLHGFEATRVERYAEYRTRYRDIAADHFPDVDLVIAVDLDAWGGWSEEGVMNGVGWLDVLPKAAGMASVSLFEQAIIMSDGQQGTMLCHYDAWAWRGPGWKQRMERHFALWVPPVGSHPILCNSAFGALCIYRADPFFAHAPVSIDGDIEHVGLHKAMADADWEFYLNPSQRTLMKWIPDESELVVGATS